MTLECNFSIYRFASSTRHGLFEVCFAMRKISEIGMLDLEGNVYLGNTNGNTMNMCTLVDILSVKSYSQET